jgi:hypothetical protein
MVIASTWSWVTYTVVTPEVLLQRRDLRAGLHPQLGVQIGQWFVHEEHLGLPDDRAAHGHPLPLAAGQRLRLAVQELLQLQQLRVLQHAVLAGLPGYLVQLERELHVVVHAHVRVQA